MPDQSSFSDRKNPPILKFATAVFGPPVGLLVFLPIVSGLVGANNPLYQPLIDLTRFVALALVTLLIGLRSYRALLLGEGGNFQLLILGMAMIAGLVALVLPNGLSVAIYLILICGFGAWDSYSYYGDVKYRKYAAIRVLMTVVCAAALILLLVQTFQ